MGLRCGRPSKVEGVRWLVVELLAEQPDVPSPEILRRVQLAGYAGGRSALYDLVAALRARDASVEGGGSRLREQEFPETRDVADNGSLLAEFVGCVAIGVGALGALEAGALSQWCRARSIGRDKALFAAKVVSGELAAAGVPAGETGVAVLARLVAEAPAGFQPILCRVAARYFIRNLGLAPGTRSSCPVRRAWCDAVAKAADDAVDALQKLFDRESVAAGVELRQHLPLTDGLPTAHLVALAHPLDPEWEGACLRAVVALHKRRIPTLREVQETVGALDLSRAGRDSRATSAPPGRTARASPNVGIGRGPSLRSGRG